jgi:hypothetical protein
VSNGGDSIGTQTQANVGRRPEDRVVAEQQGVPRLR